jgi:hyperosmotically inducible periplasmic protein
VIPTAARMRPTSRSTRERRAIRRGRSLAAAAAICGFALGMLAGFFLDPKGGRRRRHQARDRAMSRVRRGGRRAAVSARRSGSHAAGIARRTMNSRLRHPEALDDVTLAHKVESELYRRAGVPKRHVSINAEDGVVFLRGVMDRQEDIERMETEARRIAGVRDVENLVHLPGTPAPASRPKLERERAAGSRRHARHGS